MSESGVKPDAVSVKGAKGLMQVIDSTAADLGVSRVYEPIEYIQAESRYLKNMLNLFDGNLDKDLAAREKK